ncbi:hypothetical protein [Jeongeupia naejangsanensis]|nr:hypothetical protein [Jeongeupia naejangsanensis]
MKKSSYRILFFALLFILSTTSFGDRLQSSRLNKAEYNGNDPAVPFTLEIADFSYPFMSDAEQATLLSGLLKEVTIRADYVPNTIIEGKTQKTRRKFRLFSGLGGIGPIPDPHIETKIEKFEKHLETKAHWRRDSATGHYLLSFSLPARQGDLFPLSLLTLSIPNQSFWSQKSIAALPLKRDYGDVRLALTPSLEQKVGIFQLSELPLPMPANDVSRTGVVSIKGSWQQNGLTHWLRPQMLFDQDSISRILHEDGIMLGDPEQTLIKAGKIPGLIAALQFPTWFSMNPNTQNSRILAMPTTTPRWHGLHYMGRGTQLQFAEAGGFQFLQLDAEGPIEPGTRRGPSKTEHWIGFQGKLVSYRGEYNYFDDKSTLPDLNWAILFLDGRRVGSGRILTSQRNKAGEYAKLNDCPQPECQRNVAEAESQIAKRDTELQKEFEHYLYLYKQASPVN